MVKSVCCWTMTSEGQSPVLSERVDSLDRAPLSDYGDDEPTAEEIEDWARVDAPQVISGGASSGSEKEAQEQLNAVSSGPPATSLAPSSETRTKEQKLQPAAKEPADPKQQLTAANVVKSHCARDTGVAAVQTTEQNEEKLHQQIKPELQSIDRDKLQNEPLSQQASLPSTSSSWGWGGSWGLQSIGDKLKQVAVGAVNDVAELKDSFQQVLAEVTADTDPEEHSPPGEMGGIEVAPLEKRDDVLQRLQGQDNQLEAGLKAIDEQMETVASGAAKVLGSFWGGISGVAKGGWTAGQSLASKVEAAALELAKEVVTSVEEGVKDVSQLQALQVASSGIRGAAGRVSRISGTIALHAEKGLETVGRTAMGLVEGVMVEGSDGNGGGGVGDEHSFEHYFYISGGREACEELEALTNDCSRLCNRTRSQLEAEQKALLDQTLAELGPVFDLGVQLGSPETELIPQLAAHYQPVSDLCTEGLKKAALLLSAGKDIAVPANPAAKEGTKQEIEGAETAAILQEELEDAPQKSALTFLEQVRNAAAQCQAELCSAQLQLLLDLSRSVAAPTGKGSTHLAVDWPKEPLYLALQLRTVSMSMLGDAQKVADAFREILSGIAVESLAAQMATATKDLEGQLDNDYAAACTRIRDNYRGLLYATLLSFMMTKVI